MTDEPENVQQNLDKAGKAETKPGTFAPGYDPRRWLKGRGKKSPDMKKAEEIVLAVIWDELSREIKDPSGTDVDALRLMVRSMIRNKTTQKEILDRIAGKVTEKVEHTGKDGEPLIKGYLVISPDDWKKNDSK